VYVEAESGIAPTCTDVFPHRLLVSADVVKLFLVDQSPSINDKLLEETTEAERD